MRRALYIVVVLAACFLLLGAGDNAARFNNLGNNKLMCACGCRQLLLACNHVGCTYSETMRNELQAGLDRGDSDDLILQAFVQKYGTVVLAAPTSTGFNRVAWIMPFVALLGGFLLAALVIRKWKLRPASIPAAAAPGASPDLDLYRELARKETEL